MGNFRSDVPAALASLNEAEFREQEKWQDSTGWFVATDGGRREERAQIISHILDASAGDDVKHN